jgi:hypothetical protein
MSMKYVKPAGKNPIAYLKAADDEKKQRNQEWERANPPMNPEKAKSIKKRKNGKGAIPEGHYPLPNDQPQRSYQYYIAPPTNGKALLSTPEGQEQFGKLVAITQQQKDLSKDLKAKRREYEMYMQEQNELAVKKEKKKLEKKRRKLDIAQKEINEQSRQSTSKIVNQMHDDSHQKMDEN